MNNIKDRFQSLVKFSKLNTYFITTPIYYTNDKPHIGHFYTNCLADVIARWNRLKGNSVIFSTGTDDHGLKIQQAANKLNVTPKDLVNSSSDNFKNLFLSADISFTKFIRTSDDAHKSMVVGVWKDMMSKGHFTKETYAGWYSSLEECFVSDNRIKKEEQSQAHKQLEWCEEENWIFNIEKFKKGIFQWINSGVIYPVKYVPTINNFIEGINSISVSRPTNRVPWGITVPDDSSQTIYVWFDALLNYLTVSKLHKQPSLSIDTQIIGKDIIRFHTVLWPAILLALGLELPKQIIIHSHWLFEGSKMSKSLGNVVDPVMESQSLGGYEPLKYFLLSEDAISTDSIYSNTRAIERINTDLVNITGNLLSRITGLKLNPCQSIGVKDEIKEELFSGTEFKELLDKLSKLRSTFERHMEELTFHLAIESVIDVLRQTNLFLESQHPWKVSVDRYTKDAVIYVSGESLRMSAILLQCFVPIIAQKILTRLGVKKEEWALSQVRFNPTSQRIRKIKSDPSEFTLIKRL